MSDYDLKVLTDHLYELARDQQRAASQARLPTSAVNGVADEVLRTHGVICRPTHSALADAEQARHTSGTNLSKASDDLKDRLNWAAQNYSDVDFREGRDIGACGI